MANSPQKSKDATEEAVNAIQEALSVTRNAAPAVRPPVENRTGRKPTCSARRRRPKAWTTTAGRAAPPTTTAPISDRSCRRCTASRRARRCWSPPWPPRPGLPAGWPPLSQPYRAVGTAARHRLGRADRASPPPSSLPVIFILRARPHVQPRAGHAPASAETMAEVAMRLTQPEDRGARSDRQRRPGHPPRSRRHGRRRRARARPRRPNWKRWCTTRSPRSSAPTTTTKCACATCSAN